MNTEPMESIIYGSRYSAGRLSLADRWIRAQEDPDRVVRDRFEAFVQVGSVVTVTGVAVEHGLPVAGKPLASGSPGIGIAHSQWPAALSGAWSSEDRSAVSAVISSRTWSPLRASFSATS